MAFNNTARNTQQADDSWKAQGFINLYVPTPDGGRRKVGAIALKESKPFEAALLERLSTEEGVQAFADVLQIDYQPATSDAKPVLGF
jgi:hypothetical protein